jgi:peroxiredoxin
LEGKSLAICLGFLSFVRLSILSAAKPVTQPASSLWEGVRTMRFAVIASEQLLKAATVLLPSVLLLSVAPALAQVAPPATAPQPSPRAVMRDPQVQAAAYTQASADQGKFEEVLTEAVRFLRTAPSYKLDVTNHWTTSRGAEGKNFYSMVYQRPNQFRIEIQSGFSKTPELICVNDGQQVTTLHDTQLLYSQHPVGEEGELRRNVMLAQSLAGSGIDILMQPKLIEFVHAQVSGVKYHGVEALEKVRCHHFEMQWGQQRVDLWIAAQGEPMLRQFVRTTQVNISADNQFQLVATSKLNWKVGGQIAPETFQLALPREARRVHCIYESLACDEAADLVGQPMPPVELIQLDGSRLKLTPDDTKAATVLIFWASWAAPSTAEMPKVTGFVKNTAAQGVAFYAVNVGEDVSAVRRFATQHEFTSAAVSDPTGAVSNAFHIGELPAVVIIDRAGKVRSVMHGAAQDLQASVAKELQQIATTPAPAPTRPPVTGLK